jgi:DNA-directed RNA polymerase specialized sigma subunit
MRDCLPRYDRSLPVVSDIDRCVFEEFSKGRTRKDIATERGITTKRVERIVARMREVEAFEKLRERM